jgi:hypothetical protein
MRSLRERTGSELQWTQPSAMHMDYELKDGDDVVLTLKFRSLTGSHATLEGPDGCWTFKRVGYFRPRVTIRRCNEEKELGVFRNNTWANGGALELPDGRRFEANSNFWMTGYEFKSEAGDTLVAYRSIGGVFHASSRVEFDAAARSLPELPWLVGLGWYLVILMQLDAGATSAAISAAT